MHFMLGTSPYISTLVKPGIMGPHKEGWYQKFPRGTVPRSVCHFLSAALASCIGGGLMSVCATEGREGRGNSPAVCEHFLSSFGVALRIPAARVGSSDASLLLADACNQQPYTPTYEVDVKG